MTISKFVSAITAKATFDERLRHCQAEVYSNGDYAILKSYNTWVAAYNLDTDAAVVFVSYSATTWQHVHKFLSEYDPRLVFYACPRSDNLKIAKRTRYSSGRYVYEHEKYRKGEYKAAEENGFDWIFKVKSPNGWEYIPEIQGA